MKLYVDIDSLNLISTPGYNLPLDQVYVRREDTVPLEIRFTQNGVIIDPGAISVFFMMKSLGNYNEASPLLPAGSAFTKTGTDITTVFTQAVHISGAAIDTALSISTGLGVASFVAMGEISWSIGGTFLTARKFNVTIETDLNRA